MSIPGIVEVEENHLYMVPIGTDDGVKKGDTVEIIREDQKIADARLISVLADNSMAEIVVLFVRTDVLESDSVRFFKEEEEKRARTRRTLGRAETEVVETDTTARETDERRRGLLGSEMHRYEEVTAAEGPLKKEIEQLKAGLVSVRDEYEDKVDTILSAVGGERDVLAVEKKWQEKLVSTEKRYQAQYRERKRLLEKEVKRLEAEIAGLNNELKVVNEGTDKRIQQLLSDLRDREDEIASLKQEFVEEHLTSEKQWKTKLENLEAQYQNQLRTQKEDLDTKSMTESEKLQNEIDYLNEQLQLVKESAGDKNNELQVRLKEREDLIDAQRKEQFSLESDLSREQQQVRKLESDIATLKDVIAATKRVHTKELEIARKPLETKIQDMSVEFIGIKNDYERELNAVRQAAKDDLMKNESQWVEKLAAVEQKYQNQIGQMESQSAVQVNQLRAELEGQKDVVELLKQNQAELNGKLQASEQQYAQSQSELKAVENQLSVEKATRQENINLAKKPLEEKVTEMSSQMVSLRQEYERQFENLRKDNIKETDKLRKKINEDAALIEFLNNAMADLTSDLDDREQKIVQLEDDLALAQGENEAMKKSHLERIKLAKEPLEAKISDLNEEMILLNQNHENQLKTVQENTSRYLLTSEEQWQSKLRMKDEQHQTELSTLQGTMADLQKGHEDKLAEVESGYDKEVASLQAQWEEKFDTEMKQWQTKLNESESKHQKTLEEEVGKKESVIDFLKQEKANLSAQLNTLQKETDAKIREMEVIAKEGQAKVNEQWQAKLDGMKMKHQEELDGTRISLEQQWQAKVEDKERKYQIELDKEKKSNTAQVSDLQRKLDDRQRMIGVLEGEKSNLAKQISALQKDHAEEVKRLANDSKAKQTANDTKWQAKIDDLQKTHQQQVNSLKDEQSDLAKQIASLKKDHEEELRRIKDVSKKDQAANNEQWKVRLSEKEKVISLLEDEKTRLNKEKSLLEKDHADEVKRLANDSKAKQTANNEQWQTKLDSQKQVFEGKITGLNEQLNSLKKDSSSVIDDLQNELKKKQDEANSLAKKNTDLTLKLTQQKKELTEFKDSNAVLKDQVKEIESSRKKWIASVKKPLETEISKLNDEIVALKKDHEKEVKGLKEANNNSVSDLEKQWQQKLTKQQNEYEEKLKEQKTEFRRVDRKSQ